MLVMTNTKKAVSKRKRTSTQKNSVTPLYDVSVLLPVHNPATRYEEGWVQRTIWHSINNNADIRVQVVIVDDGSDDGSAEMLAGLAADDVKYIRHESKKGVGAATQTAAENADGRYFIYMSGRSWPQKDMLTKMVQALESDVEVGFVYPSIQYHGVWTKKRVASAWDRAKFVNQYLSNFSMYRSGAHGNGCAYVDYFTDDDGHVVSMHDRDFFMQMACQLHWQGKAVPDAVVNFHHSKAADQGSNLVVKHRDKVQSIFRERWKDYL